MPTCSLCRTQYPEGERICARDGQRLESSIGAASHAAPQDPGAAGIGAASTPREMPVAMFGSSGGHAGARAAAATAVRAAPALPEAKGRPEPSSETAAAPQPEIVFDSMLGATLAGRYRIVRRIGEGGMGAVYEAVHTIIGKRVAVKVLLEKFLTKTDFVARLLQEARLASAIGNEHIVDVTDFGTTDDGRAFVAMEFLDGEPLAQLVMREAPLPIDRSLRIARQVASALSAAHAKGIVHRDIKPENVYLIRRGDEDFVKVVDFGISKAVKQGQGLGDEAPDYRLTHTGLLLGTPFYMSPEQARGDENLDHRVDIWALGVMLYECLTGEVPFRANNYLGIISQVLTHAARPPSQLRPELGIPDAVESVVMRAMEKDRSLRYAEMADVERDLERLLAGDQNVGSPTAPTMAAPLQTPPPLAGGVGKGALWIWSAAALALLAGVMLVLARPRPNDRDPSTEAAPRRSLPPSETVTTPRGSLSGVEAPGTPSPGGPRSSSLPSTTETPAASVTGLASPSPHPDNAIAAERVKRTSHAVDSRNPGVRTPVVRRAPARRRGPESARSEAALRGAVPSRSGEGYPEN